MKLSGLLVCASLCMTALSQAARPFDNARRLIDGGDVLGFRVYVRSLEEQKLSPRERKDLRTLILLHVTRAGFDLLYRNDQKHSAQGTLPYTPAFQQELARADEKMLSGSFEEAFALYQKVATALNQDITLRGPRVLKEQAQTMLPYVLQSMGRALYGAGRFAESYEVYTWISPAYAKFRQTLFEKMWAAFRAGYMDRALGAIASQRSALFVQYLQPEAYLVQIYLYKKLCREEDLRKVMEEMRRFKSDLDSGAFTLQNWSRLDVEGRVLWSLLQSPVKPTFDETLVTAAAREKERNRIRDILAARVRSDRKQWSENLGMALSFAQLSLKGKSEALKPLEKLPNRTELSQMNLEIWPGDTAEEWTDEVGSHLFVGDSQCVSTQQ